MNIYIQRLIHEQFNIGNMNLNNVNQKRKVNIFNKRPIDPQELYNNILKKNITGDDIKCLDDLTAVVKPKDNDELYNVVKFYSENYKTGSLNWIDVSELKDMSCIFYNNKTYNGDISKWDMSNATDVRTMFKNSTFNNDISMWNMSSVKLMYGMFDNS